MSVLSVHLSDLFREVKNKNLKTIYYSFSLITLFFKDLYDIHVFVLT